MIRRRQGGLAVQVGLRQSVANMDKGARKVRHGQKLWVSEDVEFHRGVQPQGCIASRGEIL